MINLEKLKWNSIPATNGRPPYGSADITGLLPVNLSHYTYSAELRLYPKTAVFMYIMHFPNGDFERSSSKVPHKLLKPHFDELLKKVVDNIRDREPAPYSLAHAVFSGGDALDMVLSEMIFDDYDY